MEQCEIFAGTKCPCCDLCPFACECKDGDFETLPFLKELCCLNSTLFSMSKFVQEQNTKLPKYTLFETFFNALWIFRGAIEKAAKAVFEMGEIKNNFALFDKCLSLWERTIRETGANFLRESFIPLRAQLRLLELNNSRETERI